MTQCKSQSEMLDVLLAERSIYRNLVAFARAMDERDWGAFAEFTAEEMTASLGRGEIVGRDNIVAFIQSFLDGCGPTQHLLGNVLIDIDGDSARSSAYVADLHLGRGEKKGVSFRTLGCYHDQWQRSESGWLMTRRIKDNRATLGSMEVFDFSAQ